MVLGAVCLLPLTGVNSLVGWSEVVTPWAPFPIVIALFAATWACARVTRDVRRRLVLLVGSCACAVALEPWFAVGSVAWVVAFHRVLFGRGVVRPLVGLAFVLASFVLLGVACSRDLWPAFVDDHRVIARIGYLCAMAYPFRIAWLLHQVRVQREVLPLVDVLLYLLFAPFSVIVPYMLAIPRCDLLRTGLARHDPAVERSGVRLIAWGLALAVAAWVLRELHDPRAHFDAALRARDHLGILLYALPAYPVQAALDVSGVAAILVGLVRMLGVNLGASFQRPLVADTLTEYWRRWNTHFRDLLVELFYMPVILRLRRTRVRAILVGCASVFVVGSTLFHLPKHYFRYGSVYPPNLHIVVENIAMGALVAFALVREHRRATLPAPPAPTGLRLALRRLRTWILVLVAVFFLGYGSQFAVYGEHAPVAITPWR